jgi:hypothetical protein
MNVITAVSKELKSVPAVTSLMTGGIWKHVFPKAIDGTGQMQLMVKVGGTWFRDYESTAEFPRLQVVIMADDARDIADRRLVENGADRCLVGHKEVRSVLHRPQGGDVFWGGTNGLRILGSHCDAEPSQVNWPNSKASVFMAVYRLKIG